VNDQPSFTLIHRATETEISKANATARWCWYFVTNGLVELARKKDIVCPFS
jgi:hypothetical protein